MTAGHGKAIALAIEAQSGSFRSIGVTGEPEDATMTKKHGRVYTVTMRVAELRPVAGYSELGKVGAFPSTDYSTRCAKSR